MSNGPVDVIALSFPSAGPGPVVVDEIRRLVTSGTIGLLDALFVAHEPDGSWRIIEISEETEALEITDLEFSNPDLLSAEDGEVIAAGLAPDSSALIVAYEHLWSAPLRAALADAGGQVELHVRIDPDTVGLAEASAATEAPTQITL